MLKTIFLISISISHTSNCLLDTKIMGKISTLNAFMTRKFNLYRSSIVHLQTFALKLRFLGKSNHFFLAMHSPIFCKIPYLRNKFDKNNTETYMFIFLCPSTSSRKCVPRNIFASHFAVTWESNLNHK